MVVKVVTAEELLGGQLQVTSAASPLGHLIKKHLKWLAEWKARNARAREFAIERHGTQRYGDRPYADHLTQVVAVLIDFGFSGPYLCAAWLHDVLEDTPTTLEEIRREFGPEVAKLVDAVSGGGDRQNHIASIYKKIGAYPDAAYVKLADRVANVEACRLGDKHALRYLREHESFAAAVRPFVQCEMWNRYEKAVKALN